MRRPICQDLAERMAPHIRWIRAEHPELVDPAARGDRSATRVAAAAMQELYNPAQVDVVRQVQQLLRAEARQIGLFDGAHPDVAAPRCGAR
jgi:hypothetical protein